MFSPKQYVLWFVRGFVLLLCVVGAFQLWLDPFWAWRTTPPWLSWHSGHNFNLDVRMRTAKALQLLTRNPETIIIGSSRVNHGFDVSTLPNAYNLGLSGLRARELEAYVRYSLMHTRVRHLIIGLDYFMFDARHPTVAGFNPALTHPRYVFDAVPAALFSANAISGARYAIKGHKAREGVWDYHGFKRLHSISADAIPAMMKAERENLGRVVPDEEAYDAVARALRLTKAQGISVTLYLSPMHPLQMQSLAEDDATQRFDTWRQRITEIASDEHIVLHDFTAQRFGDEALLAQRGSIDYWQDVTHFTPKAGVKLLTRMRVAASAND